MNDDEEKLDLFPKIVRKRARLYYRGRKKRLYVNTQGVLCCARKPSDRPIYSNDLIVLPQLFQPETIRLAHNDTGHQGVHKVASRILQRYEWPGIYDSVNKWIGSCITCLQAKNPPGRTKFPLKNIESYRFKELVQIDHTPFANISAEGHKQALVMIDQYTKFAEAVPCGDCNAEQICELLIRKWFSRYGPPTSRVTTHLTLQPR